MFRERRHTRQAETSAVSNISSRQRLLVHRRPTHGESPIKQLTPRHLVVASVFFAQLQARQQRFLKLLASTYMCMQSIHPLELCDTRYRHTCFVCFVVKLLLKLDFSCSTQQYSTYAVQDTKIRTRNGISGPSWISYLRRCAFYVH